MTQLRIEIKEKKCWIHRDSTYEPGEHDSIILHNNQGNGVSILVDVHLDNVMESIGIRLDRKQAQKLFEDFKKVMEPKNVEQSSKPSA